MKIESVDLFYLAMPHVRDVGDGSQDALLVRVRAAGLSGWGECEASPLVSIAGYCCPASHAACKPVRDTVLGWTVDAPADIVRLGEAVRANGLDIAQTDHTFSGIEVALWDLLGKQRGQPVYQMLGYPRALAKVPYASQLFGDTAAQTYELARASRAGGYRAVKFGWGPYGRGSVAADRDQVAAARAGLSADGVLLVDAGTVWGEDLALAQPRLEALVEHRALWLEEPFVGGATDAYASLAKLSGPVRLAGGEGAHNFHMARSLIDHGRIGFVQIDTGRIGGIAPAKRVADYAALRGVSYVNHTFTTHLALSASLQPFAGVQRDEICEYPVSPSSLAAELNNHELAPGPDGLVHVPERPGLGVEVNLAAVRKYLVDAEISVGGRVIYRTPTV
jgi:L-alanine-DL-glutamate epimerase-like enolase superfamily enzyme